MRVFSLSPPFFSILPWPQKNLSQKCCLQLDYDKYYIVHGKKSLNKSYTWAAHQWIFFSLCRWFSQRKRNDVSFLEVNFCWIPTGIFLNESNWFCVLDIGHSKGSVFISIFLCWFLFTMSVFFSSVRLPTKPQLSNTDLLKELSFL